MLSLIFICLGASSLVTASVAGRDVGVASSFAGSTSTAVFPPAGQSATPGDLDFPDGSQVGFAGPTPTGDEGAVIATAPAFAKTDSTFPLVRPDTADGKGKTFNVFQHWGSLTPAHSVESFGLPNASPQIPDGCTINQVHLLHRHGARYPTLGSPPSSFASALHAAATANGFTASGPLEFLNTWTYKLGAEILTPLGRSELFDLGVGFRVRYGELLKGFENLPVWRTTSQERMLDSALHFAAGFFGVQNYQSEYHQLITIEAGGFNNSLASYSNCPNANNDIAGFGSVQANKWADIYLKEAVNRLQPSISGFTLNSTYLVGMQQLCAFETVALGYSAFCDLFTEDEWKSYEYFVDLSFWYGNGPGNPAAAAQGIGYVQELVSRLTETPIISSEITSSNYTIVSNTTLFPLSQPIFVDVTHDTIMTAILTAMNITKLTSSGPLPTDHIPQQYEWTINRIAPFATNLVGQVLSCAASSIPTHIRFILNDAILPLIGIRGCSEEANGLCGLPEFINGTKARIAEVDFGFDCFGNYTIPVPDNIVDGRFPPYLRNGAM